MECRKNYGYEYGGWVGPCSVSARWEEDTARAAGGNSPMRSQLGTMVHGVGAERGDATAREVRRVGCQQGLGATGGPA
ncbi:hypothetical protein F751_5338 [Auxenochlorella protothecoides]|uniref:Uncharacterized protein n=1 Tax=Auxenochlorella protothecoides TaxID=3075 RepID=A0A087SRS1_AUXPR|nr:hypothetical protein F751_5338 [Auxenochlorella protothecoides]KFM28425.1 hypothetical protein F751_5338 [Auxenochlorella protothecoides]